MVLSALVALKRTLYGEITINMLVRSVRVLFMSKAALSTGSFVTAVVILAVLVFMLAHRGFVEHQSFKAFYCAGVAVNHGEDPYRVEPLRSCERRILTTPMPTGYVEPAPLPGYAIIPFAALAKFSPRVASEMFSVALILAAAAAAWLLGSMLPASRLAILLALTPLTLINVTLGEVAPLAMLCLCAAAFLLARSTWSAAAIAVAAAMIQPNIALPAAAAVFFFAPRARLALTVSVVVLAAASIAAIGLSRNIEYFAQVLPLHAASELVASDQYSSSRLLYVLGFSEATSLGVAKVIYAAMALIGVTIAGLIARRQKNPELLPLLPAATALFFGVFVHGIQLLLALPAALIIATRVRGKVPLILAAIAVALLVPIWGQGVSRPVVLFNALGVAGGIFAILRGALPRRIAVTALVTVAISACVFVNERLEYPTVADVVTQPFSVKSDDMASLAWGRYLRATPALTTVEIGEKLPGWFGLLALILSSVTLVLRQASPTAMDTSFIQQPVQKPETFPT